MLAAAAISHLFTWTVSDIAMSPAIARVRHAHPIASVEPQDPGLQLPISALSAGITAAIEVAAEDEMRELSAGKAVDLRALELDEEELSGHKQRLLTEIGDLEEAGVVFQSDGTPSPSTLGLALVLTAQSAAELDFPSMSALEAGALPTHQERARVALATVASNALAEVEEAMDSGSQTREEARSIHKRWATLELARAHFEGDMPEDWGK